MRVEQMLCLLAVMVACAQARPDSAGHAKLPAPGYSFGGIPYGSVSGNVAEFYKRQAPSVGQGGHLYTTKIDFTPIEHWLR